MADTTHTPGPWHICEVTGRDLKLIRDANGYCVAEAVNPAVQAAQYINADANARLIAAAPDLLAALDEIFNGTGMTGPNMDAARAAISKAKGA